MKKKLLLSILALFIFLVVFALGISATTIYKDEAGNELFRHDQENGIITTYEGEFPKTDKDGNALTWYVTGTKDENGNTVKTVASVLTLDENYATLNDGKYSYKTSTVNTTNVVSVYFPSDKGITTLNLANGGYKRNNGWDPTGSEILFVYLPSTLTTLPERIVQGSKVLVCEMPSEMPITEISHVAFYEAKCLREINIPSSVKIIKGRSKNDGTAFYACSSLERVTFGENSQLETIETQAFQYNTSLKYVRLPDGLKTIGTHAFSETDLRESPFSPTSRCEELGGRCFNGIPALETFIVPATLKNVVIFGSADYGPLSESSVALVTFGTAAPITELSPSFFGRAKIGKIILPNGPTNIPNRYFIWATIKDVCFSDTIETASERVFQDATVEVIRLGANFKHFINSLDDNHSFTNVTKGVREIYLPASFYAEKPDTVYHVGYAFAIGGSGSANANFFYAGSEEQLAIALANYKEGTKASGTENWRFLGAKIVSYDDYIKDSAQYESGNYIIYGYDPCLAFCTPFYEEDTVREATIVYDDYLLGGLKTTICPLCGGRSEGETTPALFSCLGYSAPTFGDGGISVCYIANKTAIAEYEKATGKSVSYGVFAVSFNKLGTGDAVMSSGEFAKGVIGTSVEGAADRVFEIKIVGFVTQEQMDAKLVLSAYVIATKDGVGVVSYMQPNSPASGERYSYTTYNSLLKAE